ncbi:MAG: tetratricopeptide repeat protein [Syntrophales bacterium]
MAIEIKREEIAKIIKQLHDCKAKIKQGNVHTCLVYFKSVLEKTLGTQMLPSDEKALMEEVNSFQLTLSESKDFKKIFGPVSFHAKDLSSSLEFVRQLVSVGDEGVRDNVDLSQKSDASVQDAATDIETEAQGIMNIIDQGEYGQARELIADNDLLVTFIVQTYNRNGIRFRKEGAYDKAIGEFEKALAILPDDEGLHYNIARVQVERKDWKLAESSIREALKINPLFREGNDLLQYINEKA